jgi:hypothetical protein
MWLVCVNGWHTDHRASCPDVLKDLIMRVFRKARVEQHPQAVLDQQILDRAEQDRRGYPGPVKSELIAIPRLNSSGKQIIHPRHEIPGPLDGKGSFNYEAHFTYTNGVKVVIDSAGKKGRSWPGGREDV